MMRWELTLCGETAVMGALICIKKTSYVPCFLRWFELLFDLLWIRRMISCVDGYQKNVVVIGEAYKEEFLSR